MARAHFADVLLAESPSGSLSLLSGATVTVVDQGTSTPISATIYDADSGSGTLTNPLTSDANGKVEFWLATAARVDLIATKTGYATQTRTVDVEDAPAGVSGVPIHEEFLPANLATTVTLAHTPIAVLTVARDGVVQSVAAGHYTVSGDTLTFGMAFDGSQRVIVASTY